MTVATTSRAEFLKSEESSEVAIDATLRARWGDAAGDTAQSSVLINKADATAEAARQLALLGSVFAVDSVQIEGVHWDLDGKTVRVAYTMPGGGNYFGGAANVDILVAKSRPNLAEGFTVIEGFVVL